MDLNVFHTTSFLQTAGYLGLFVIVWAETSVFIGFFLPGDTLLFTAGILSSLGYFDVESVLLVSFLAAVVGDSVGYAIGKKYGDKIFHKENSKVFSKEHIGRAERFYQRHGGKTLVFARFLPVVRTAVPVLAGVGSMPYMVFLFYNVVGAAVWTASLVLLGYFVGQAAPRADYYLLAGIVLVLLLVFGPAIFAVLKDKDRRKKLMEFFKRHLD